MKDEETKKLHEEAIKNNKNFYIEPGTGFMIWTKDFLLKREFCCENDCKHCPYIKEEK